MTQSIKSMTLTEFLLARIAEDEAWAQARWEPSVARSGPDTAVSIRLRKECEAKRRIVAAVCTTGREVREAVAPGRYNVRRELVPLDEMGGDIILPLMAAVYADHPDYDPEWRH